MTVKSCLRKTKEMLVKEARENAGGGRSLHWVVDRCSESPAEADAAIELIERVACPAWCALQAQMVRWAETQANEDGRRAIELAQVPGFDVSLWEWLKQPSLTLGRVLKVINAAILKA